MIPKTLSASSLQVAALCPVRWKAEYIDRVPAPSNNAALTGSAVHGGLENFVKAVFIDKTHTGLDKKQLKELLITFYQMSFIQTFGHGDLSTDEYKDGLDLTNKWFARTDLSEKRMIGVESVELKETIEVPFNHPDGTVHNLNFNYIMDRVDQIDETTWEVVDYKTIRVPIQPGDLWTKIQARAYALAIQIKHPEAQKVIVTFDLLRHEQVGIEFNRDDNINFWRYLCAETQRLVDLDADTIKPNINSECGFCVVKATCPEMQRNIAGGGTFSLSIDEAVATVAAIKSQMSASKRVVEELEDIIFKYAAENESLEWDTGDGSYEVEVTSSRRRGFDSKKAAEIMGPALFAQMGSMTLGNLEKIIGDDSIEQSVRDELKKLIGWNNGNLGLKIKPKKTII